MPNVVLLKQLYTNVNAHYCSVKSHSLFDDTINCKHWQKPPTGGPVAQPLTREKR